MIDQRPETLPTANQAAPLPLPVAEAFPEQFLRRVREIFKSSSRDGPLGCFVPKRKTRLNLNQALPKSITAIRQKT